MCTSHEEHGPEFEASYTLADDGGSVSGAMHRGWVHVDDVHPKSEVIAWRCVPSGSG